MASAAYGLRHPASASCLGRHLRLAGRCPNNSSLFPPLAAVVVVASHFQRKNDLDFRDTGASADAPVSLFHGRGRKGKEYLQRRFLRKRSAAVKVLTGSQLPEPSQAHIRSPAPPKGELLICPQALHLSRKPCRHAKGSLPEGAGKANRL